MSISTRLALGAALSLGLAAGAASAGTVNLTGMTGKWTSADPASVSGVGTQTISWGGSTGSGQSSYTFAPGAVPQDDILADTAFNFGSFTHSNNPVLPPSLTTAALSVTLDFTIDGAAYSVDSVFDFNHEETPNSTNPCPYGGNSVGCSDRVTALTNAGATASFLIGTDTYKFNFIGFHASADGTGTPISFFDTFEGQDNTAFLFAEYTLESNLPPVPLPAAGWMLIAAIGGIAALKRRRAAA